MRERPIFDTLDIIGALLAAAIVLWLIYWGVF